MNKIKINGSEYNIKYTIRALFIFEQITQKPFKIESLLDNYIFYYSMILANNRDTVLDWDVFIDEVDKNPGLLKEMEKLIVDQEKKDKVFEVEEGDNKKKD